MAEHNTGTWIDERQSSSFLRAPRETIRQGHIGVCAQGWGNSELGLQETMCVANGVHGVWLARLLRTPEHCLTGIVGSRPVLSCLVFVPRVPSVSAQWSQSMRA